MKAADLRTKKEVELKQDLNGLLQEHFNLRMQKGSGQAVKAQELRRIRRNIARVRTVLNEKSRQGRTA